MTQILLFYLVGYACILLYLDLRKANKLTQDQTCPGMALPHLLCPTCFRIHDGGFFSGIWGLTK